jgi:hypothetical protein
MGKGENKLIFPSLLREMSGLTCGLVSHSSLSAMQNQRLTIG